MDRKWLYGLTLRQLSETVASLGLPAFTARQIASWIYNKGVAQIEAMTDISLRGRELLGRDHCVGRTAPSAVETSVDGTKKYLFRTSGGNHIETAYITDGDRATLCVSSQCGCRMGCRFCMTARGGFGGNLSAGEILNQIRSIPESDALTNVVYMGMGEPLDNLDAVLASLEVLTSDWGYGWSPTRITVSTIGVLPVLNRLLDDSRAHVAVSLHNPFPDQRASVMPVEKVWPVAEVVRLLRRYDFSHQRRISFEYIMFEGFNDSPAHIRELARLLDGLKCRINLIRFHAIPDSPFVSPSPERMVAFRDALTAKGIITTIRASCGEDIRAACGLLSIRQAVGYGLSAPNRP
ncbi:MAG: 23S rRNA (adenine(2503)-C(2))-methyltransferase RlmN [Rikenellaceae bacterium]|jgi:23S rRNA (adenine2503-C2)-methyltransferase|nr:23S rRNA (adenine(2503)-C(2))-methyltransferase RlmN [Rikenellaceae bacterium]